MQRFLHFIWLLLLCCLAAALSGCGDSAIPAAETTDAPIVIALAPSATPTPESTPTPEPEMLFDDDGDITLREDIAAAFDTATFPLGRAPVVLIYHTHATEAYKKVGRYAYQETEPGRTENTAYNIVGLGDLLAEALKARGFAVLHDRTDVEKPDLSGAYARSLTIMERYDNVDLYLDLHRNASSQRGRSDNTVLVDGVPCAKIFFVVGTGIGNYEGEYSELPDWRRNYTLALSVGERIAAKAPELVKPIRLKVGRYNQHMGLCLLTEIGTNADTLEAAQNTVPYLADALKTVFELKDMPPKPLSTPEPPAF